MNKPESISKAERLLKMSAFLGISNGILMYAYNESFYMQANQTPLAAIVALIGPGYMFLIAHKIGEGKNWARVLLFISLVFGVFGSLMIPQYFNDSLFLGLSTSLTVILQYSAGFILITSSEAKTYFSKKNNHTESEKIQSKAPTNNVVNIDSKKEINLDDLEKIAELKDKGILSEEEFNEQKKKILAS